MRVYTAEMMSYLPGLGHHLGAVAGLQAFLAVHLCVLALALILAHDWPILTDGRLEVVVRQGRIGVLEGILKDRQTDEHITASLIKPML